MRIAVLSDLHVGACPRSDAFGHEPRAFCRLLDQLERTHDEVVLLGDVFQCDHGPRHGRRHYAAELRRAMKRAPWLVERLQRPGWRYVHGNHDAIARSALGAATRLRLGDDDEAVVLVHGHAYDPVIGSAPRVSSWATYGSGRLRRLGLPGLASWLEDRDVGVKAARFQGPGGPYARGAAALLAEERAWAVVMGHTHVSTRMEVPGGVYANTGTCSAGRISFVSVDTARREVEVHQEA